MSLTHVTTIRRYLEENQLDAVEVLALLLHTITEEHIATRRSIESGRAPAAVLDVVERLEEQAEENCEDYPPVTTLELVNHLLKRNIADGGAALMEAGPMASLSQGQQADQAAKDHLYLLCEDVRELIAGFLDSANKQCEDEESNDQREAA